MGHNHDDHDHDHDHYYDDSILHDNQYVFFSHYLEMLKACENGLKYIIYNRTSVIIGKNMVNDCIETLKAIQDANFLAWSIMKKIDITAYDAINAYERLTPYIEEAEDYFEALDIDQTFIILEQNILPQYISWSDRVRDILEKHIPKNLG